MISKITDRVLPDMKAWQSRPLEGKYIVMFLDTIHYHVNEGQVVKKAVYIAIGVSLDGTDVHRRKREREVLVGRAERPEGPRYGRHTRMLRGRALRLLRRGLHPISPDGYPEVRYTPDTLLPPLRGLEGHEWLRIRPQEDTHKANTQQEAWNQLDAFDSK